MSPVVHRIVAVANVLCAVCLLVLALVPEVPGGTAVPDRTAHTMAYGIQSGLLYLLILPSAGRWPAAVFAAVGAAGYGAFVEVLQTLQPARSPELSDVVANAVGAGLVAVAAYLVTGVLAREELR